MAVMSCTPAPVACPAQRRFAVSIIVRYEAIFLRGLCVVGGMQHRISEPQTTAGKGAAHINVALRICRDAGDVQIIRQELSAPQERAILR